MSFGGEPVATIDLPSPKSIRHCTTFGEQRAKVTASGARPVVGDATMANFPDLHAGLLEVVVEVVVEGCFERDELLAVAF